MVYQGAAHDFHWEDPAQFSSDLLAFAQVLANPTAKLVHQRKGVRLYGQLDSKRMLDVGKKAAFVKGVGK